MGLAMLNPFKKDRQNYPGVVIPLSSAPVRSHTNADPEKKKDDPSTDGPKTLDRAPSSENGSAGSLPDSGPLTLEALRTEIEAETSTSGHDSVYDRMSSPWFQSRSIYTLTPWTASVSGFLDDLTWMM